MTENAALKLPRAAFLVLAASPGRCRGNKDHAIAFYSTRRVSTSAFRDAQVVAAHSEVAWQPVRRHDATMGHDRAHQGTPDLFGTPSLGATSRSATRAPEQRHVLPKDLPKSLKHLTDRELDLLITAAVEEARRRGRAPTIGHADESIPKRSSRHTRQDEVRSLTRGQINAVQAAFKAGIKPSLIARQFGLSQSDVRKVLASDTAIRAGQR
jgi:hypothetical protein